MKKIIALLLAMTLVVGLAACGEKTPTPTPTPEGESSEEPTTVPASTDSVNGKNPAVTMASEPESIDPALNTSNDGGTMIGHMFEGLMAYEDNGSGEAVVVPGQAATHEKGDIAADGTVTYTFHMRDGIKWSDGKDVTAGDFEYSMKRLVDPKTTSQYNYMIDMIVNANEIMAGTVPADQLGIKAIDDKTLEVVLTYDCPYFLEVLAFPAVMPVRQDILEASGDQWTFEPSTYVSNGPMKMSEWVHNSFIMMVPNENYYNPGKVTVDSLKWLLMDDHNAMLSGYRNGEIDFTRDVPVDEIQALKDSGELKVKEMSGIYYACFNNSRAPFDNALVREAFSLVIDRNYITEEIKRTGEVPADGYVPAGVPDATQGSDFREAGGGYYKVDDSDETYQANCDRARELLAEAGYPNGEGFPIVEYLYNTNDDHKVIGEALQNMWATELGVTVTLNNQDWAVFLQTRQDGNYDVSRNGWLADFNDPITYLDMWVTGGGNNDAQYSNPKYDEAIAAAKATAVPEERMKFMHDAENIFMGEDKAVAPIYFYTQKYLLKDNYEGMFFTPMGYFFFMGLHQDGETAAVPAPLVDAATPATETSVAPEGSVTSEVITEGTTDAITEELELETATEEESSATTA